MFLYLWSVVSICGLVVSFLKLGDLIFFLFLVIRIRLMGNLVFDVWNVWSVERNVVFGFF